MNGEEHDKQRRDRHFEREPMMQAGNDDPKKRPSPDYGLRYAYGSIEARLLG
jgi:hypothetical protein